MGNGKPTGLMVTEPSSLRDKADRMTATPQDRPGWVSRAERRDSSLVVSFSGPTTPGFSGRVRNVSTSGMLIEAPQQVSVGDVLTAHMPGRGDTLCRVVRVTGRGAGVRFLQQVNEDDTSAWC